MIDDKIKLNQINFNDSDENVRFSLNDNNQDNLHRRRIIRHSVDEYSDNEDENIEENDENADDYDDNDENTNNNFESNRNRSAEPKEQLRTMSRMKLSSMKQKIRSYPLSDKNQLHCDYLLNIATAYNSSSFSSNYPRTRSSSSNTLKYYHDYIPIIMEQRIIIESEQLELNLRLHPNFALLCKFNFLLFLILI